MVTMRSALGRIIRSSTEQVLEAQRALPERLSIVWTASDITFGRFLAVAAQLGLVLLVADAFNIEESTGFLLLAPVIFFGFVVNAWLPLHYRRPFFLLLSLVAVELIFPFPHSAGLILIGLFLIGICHLPVGFGVRIALLLGVAGGLAAIRAGWVETSWESLPTQVLPILGAIFMFRLIIYLYDLRHEKKPATLSERLSYFFLLPNVCFPLFPVVDYQTYRRTYYDAEAHEIYQKGILWIFRGISHLLIYRIVYYYLVPSPDDVQSLGGVVQFMLTNYLLYLRISGHFHLIVGILCLFGFNLPETHHLYYLASSFNDYWRRINIYWKDFMMKIFYYPAFMRLRKRGTATALALSTVVVFVATWLLHSYQWFWLRGTFPITGPDTLFWGILGGLVVVNTLREARRGRKRSLGKSEWAFRDALVYAAKVVGMFAFITVLWSLWSSPTFGEWLSLMAAAGNSGAGAYALLALGLVALIGLGILLQYVSHRGWRLTLVGNEPSFQRSAAYVTSVSLVLLLAGIVPTRGYLGSEASALVASLQETKLNQTDQATLERGYYEDLLDAHSFTSALWAVQGGRPDGWESMRETAFVRPGDGLLDFELIPSTSSTFKDAPFETNEWGMRDRAYAQAKPPGTYRVAMLGSSYAMGSGVDADRIFESLLEDRLNRDHAGEMYDRYEILNFSVGGYSVLHNLQLAEQKVFAFEPDALLFVIHMTETDRLMLHLPYLAGEGHIYRTYPYLGEVMNEAGVEPGMPRAEMRRRLTPHLYDLIGWGFEQIAAAALDRGVTPVAVLIPRTIDSEGMDPETVARLTDLTRDAGFGVLNLEGAYAGEDEASIQIAAWDTHPNELGHELIADRLYEELRESEQELDLGLFARLEGKASDQPETTP